MVKSKPLGEEVLSLFSTYRLSRHKANTFLKLFFCLHTTHREETPSEDSTCLHTALGQRRSSPCPVPASCKVTIATHCTAGDARGTGLTPVPWGSLGMQVALSCPATFRVFKKEKHTKNRHHSPPCLGNIPNIFPNISVVHYYLFPFFFFFPVAAKQRQMMQKWYQHVPCTYRRYHPTWRHPNLSPVQ